MCFHEQKSKPAIKQLNIFTLEPYWHGLIQNIAYIEDYSNQFAGI